MFFKIIQHLLPNARAWRTTIDKRLRQFFESFEDLGGDIRQFVDDVYLDLFPSTTRELALWEAQWGLLDSDLTEQGRRDRLDAAWKALGGQSPRYIQDTLQGAGFDVYVHEWWQMPLTTPAVPRSPLNYLDDGAGGTSYLMFDGGGAAQDGGALAQDGATSAPVGYPLVNKLLISGISSQDGAQSMQDGGVAAQDGSALVEYSQRRYIIPTDPAYWPYFLYIGGATFPALATVPSSRKDEFETLCLKICPAQQWLGILVNYS